MGKLQLVVTERQMIGAMQGMDGNALLLTVMQRTLIVVWVQLFYESGVSCWLSKASR